ncbi:unnamed protein product [Rotaria sordida]|uniref:Uncharacterized protein n=1 Tax=Rotaria sordida TaxID=392033 RepID=A0A814NMQ4_9BILA|nr:unnamed protein product [Rotaria sordida]CAF1291009.1 unnamed protein product [Rotaria sordida]
MPHLFINQQTKTNTNDGLSSVIDTYADAILRTFASLKPPSSITLITSRKHHHHHSHSILPTVINSSLDNQLILSETPSLSSSSASSSSSSINENQFTLKTHLPLVTTKNQSLKTFQRLISRLDKIYNNKKMSTKTLLPSSHINDRYFFPSYSHNTRKTRLSSKNKLDNTSPLLRKRYKFSSTNTNKNIYKFPTNQFEKRSYSIDSDRYYFPSKNSIKNSQQTLKYKPKTNNFEQYSVTYIDDTSTFISDTPYQFSTTTETKQYPSTTSTYLHSQDTSTYQHEKSQRTLDGFSDSSLHTSSISPDFRQTKRLDTVTSTNGSLSKIKRLRTEKIPNVHFEPSSTTVHSYLNEARDRLSVKRYDQSPESFEKSVDRLVSSVNKKYGQQQQQQQIISPSNLSTLNYISQYYIKDDQTLIDYPLDIEIDDEQKKFYYNLNTNRTHTQIMKNLNKSLINYDYQIDKNRLKYLQQNVRRCLRSYENQTLQHELNYNLLRCFSSSYLDDLKRENIRYIHTRNNLYSYTYEDIQDIYVPSILEAYKMKINIDREKSHRLPLSITTESLSPMSSSGFSPIMIGSFNDNLDTQSTGFETDRKSYTSISQPVTNIHPNRDLFYEIMQENFLGIDASIAGHVSKATQCKREKLSHQYYRKTRHTDSDIDIQTYSSIWSDDDDDNNNTNELDENYYHIEKTNQKQINSNQRKISRYLSTVNRSLLDHPSDLIADFYLSQLNRNMQDSVRHIELISYDKAHKQDFFNNYTKKLERSLSAEHLYQVRKEHIRYKQSFKTPTSFTTEDVTDIYKPFVLENYKRKIAIELERRRRIRQEQYHLNIVTSSIHNSEIDLSNNLIKYSHPPIINIHHQSQSHDFITTTPSNVVQTKEIIMGRARRTLIDDGSNEIIHHVGIISPPPIYSILIPSTSQINTTIYDQHEIPHITTVDPPDFIDQKQIYIRQEQDYSDKIIDTSRQVIISHSPYRPKTKIYTHLPHSKINQISQAKQIETESDTRKLSTITITPIITLNRYEVNQFNEFIQQTKNFQIPQDNYQHAMLLVPSEQPLSLAVQSNNEQITQYIEQEQKHEHSTLKILRNEHMTVIQEEIPIFENVQTISSNTFANDILSDIDVSLHICQRNKQPTILNTSEPFNERNDKILLNEETKDIDEQLPVYEKVTITNEISYANLFAQPLNVQVFDEFVPLASLLEESNTTTTIHKQHAKQIIDDWKTYEKVQENIRMSIIIDDKEWIDESIHTISNEFQSIIENAENKNSDNFEYEQIKINLPEQFLNKSIINNQISEKLLKNSFEQQIIDNDEQVISLLDDSYLIQQQANIFIDEQPYLENSIHIQNILILNYPNHNYKQTYKNIQQQEKKFLKKNQEQSLTISSDHIEKFSIDSQISSFIDMETFLNHFEECLDHEQHLPLIDQISLSYVTSKIERCEQKNHVLPIQWFKSIIQSQDEQLVEQWTVEKDIDTIQHESTLHRQPIELINNTEYMNFLTTNIFPMNKKFEDEEEEEEEENSSLRNIEENNYMTDILTYCSPTSDYETDSLDKDNDIVTSNINNVVIIPITSTTNILPTSSITNTTLSSSSPLTSYTAPTTVPVVYFLDALATEINQINNPTKNFLLTIGFGQNEMNKTMNETTENIISNINDQLQQATWINRPLESIEILPTIIHHEQETNISSIQEQIFFATENQIDKDETALLIYPYRLQYGYDLNENIQESLNSFLESSHIHLPIIDEIYTYQISFHNDFSLFHPPDRLPHMLSFVIQDDEIISPSEYEINQQELLSFGRIHNLSDDEKDVQITSFKYDQPTYIDHYHIQSLYPFPEPCYAEIIQPDFIIKNDNNEFLSEIRSRKYNKYENESKLNQYDQTDLMLQNAINNKIDHEYKKLNIPTSTKPVEVRPPAPTESGPIYEDVSMKKTVDVNMGTSGQYKQQATYNYGSEKDLTTKHSIIERTPVIMQAPLISTHINRKDDNILVPETIIEHISEDEKSITSEEAFFEEWSEEFRCRRTDEYDQNTQKLIRSIIDETSERIKSDVIKEEYKEKNVRIKRHKSYDIVKEVQRSVPSSTIIPIDQVQTNIFEEIHQPPPPPPPPSSSSFPSLPITMTIPSSSLSQDRQWTTEDTYTAEIAYNSKLAKDIESQTQKFDSSLSSKTYDRVRPGRYSPIPSTTQATISTIPSSHYERVSTIVTPTTLHYPEKRKQEHEDFISEEYHVEIDTPKIRHETSEDDLGDSYITTTQTSPIRRDSDWRNKLREIYAPTSDDDRYDQYKKYFDRNYIAQHASMTPSYTQQRFKEIEFQIPRRDRTYIDQRKFKSIPDKKKSYYSSIDENEQKKKRVYFVDSTTREKPISTSSIDEDDRRRQSPKYIPSSTIDEHRKQYEQITTKTDRPSFGRVDELKNTFESTRNGFIKDDNTTKYQYSITTNGLTEQRRKLFEEREQTNKERTRRPINEFDSNERRMSETHTVPSIITDRLSHIDSIESKSTSRIQPSEHLGKKEFDAITSKLESSIIKPIPQTTIDIQIKKKQAQSTIDSDTSRLLQTTTTPKSTKQIHVEDAGHESEDELSDAKQNYDLRRRTSKTRLRDYSQNTLQPIDNTNLTVQQTTTKFNERNMENILSHVPISKGKGILVELASDLSPISTKSIHDQNKSNITTDSGIYEQTTTTSQQLRTSSPSWRQNVSTSITDDATRTYENGVYIDSTTPSTISSYARRQTSDTDQTPIQNLDDSISRSTYKYSTEIPPSEPIHTHPQQRTVRRQLISSTSDDYENLSNYQSGIDKKGKVPIITQSRSRKPLVVDEIETIETETHVECQVQRTNEIKESIKTERISSPISSSKKIYSTYSSSDETTTTPTKRILVDERPQYYESTKTTDSSIHEAIPVRIEPTWFKPIEREQSQENIRHSSLTRTNNINTHTMEVTSLSPHNQIIFDKHSPNEIVAIVRVPELISDVKKKTTIRHGISEPELSEKIKQDEGRSRSHYQRAHATNYLPPSISQQYRQRQDRSRIGPTGTKRDYSSQISYPTRSSSYHLSLHDQNQQQQQQQQQQQRSYSPSSKLTYYPQTKYHSSSLDNLINSNLDFEIEIEKRPPQYPPQPTVISLDQDSRAIVTTSKDGRVSIQNVLARPGNMVTINSDFHSSDRSLNRSSGYFSSDEFRYQCPNTNYSSDEQSNSPNQTYSSYYHSKQPYYFDQVNEIVHNYSQPSNNFNETIDQIDALYNNLDIQTNDQIYKFSKPISTKNRRKELSKNSNEYSKRYTSTGFQHIPYEQQQQQQMTSNIDNNNNKQNWTSSSPTLTNLVMSTPIRPSKSLSSSGIMADYETSNSISPNSGYGSTQNMIVYQNRLNDQSQIVQRNRTSVKQVKQKNAAKKRHGLTQGHYSDEDDDNDSPLSDHSSLEQRTQPSSRLYNFNNYHQ